MKAVKHFKNINLVEFLVLIDKSILNSNIEFSLT